MTVALGRVRTEQRAFNQRRDYTYRVWISPSTTGQTQTQGNNDNNSNRTTTTTARTKTTYLFQWQARWRMTRTWRKTGLVEGTLNHSPEEMKKFEFFTKAGSCYIGNAHLNALESVMQIPHSALFRLFHSVFKIKVVVVAGTAIAGARERKWAWSELVSKLCVHSEHRKTSNLL